MTVPLSHPVREAETRPLHEPTHEEFKDALTILADHWNREWEATRPAREARARERISDWLSHAEGCERRAREYEAAGQTELADDQRQKAQFARQQIEIAKGYLR